MAEKGRFVSIFEPIEESDDAVGFKLELNAVVMYNRFVTIARDEGDDVSRARDVDGAIRSVSFLVPISEC